MGPVKSIHCSQDFACSLFSAIFKKELNPAFKVVQQPGMLLVGFRHSAQ